MHCRALLIGAALTAALVGPGAGGASADDPMPAPSPTVGSIPSVSPPSQQQIDDARSALERVRNAGASAPADPTVAQVVGPAADPVRGRVTSRISDEGWWTLGAGLLVLLVASETTRVSVRRAKHRKGA